MDTNKTRLEIDNAITELEQLIDSFSQEQINIIPFAGSWTAGQLGQHMILSHSGFVQMLNGPVKDTGRNPEEQVERIKTDFLNFNIKMDSPDFVVPPKIDYEKEHLLNSLKDINKDLDDALETLDMSKTCLAFELPVMGFLTRWEAVHFVLYHTQRHIHQLKNIHGKVVNFN